MYIYIVRSFSGLSIADFFLTAVFLRSLQLLFKFRTFGNHYLKSIIKFITKLTDRLDDLGLSAKLADNPGQPSYTKRESGQLLKCPCPGDPISFTYLVFKLLMYFLFKIVLLK